MIDRIYDDIPPAPCDIDVLAGALLRFCGNHAEALREVYGHQKGSELLSQAIDAMEEWFDQEAEQRSELALEDDQLQELSHHMTSHMNRALHAGLNTEQAAVLVSRAAVEGLDNAKGAYFFELFRLRGQVRLAPGDPFPVVNPDWRQMYGNRLGTNPENLGSPISELPGLNIMQTFDRGHQVCLEFDHLDHLDDLDQDSTIGVAIPCEGLDDLEWDQVFDAAQDRATFFHVRPRDEANQWHAIQSLLEEAEREQVRILVYPELTFTPEMVEHLRQWLDHHSYYLSAVICGSIHEIRGQEKRNVSTTLIPRRSPIEHYKFNRFSFPIQGPDNQRIDCHEDIVATPSVVTVYMSKYWSLTTLICKDFIEKSIPEILACLSVRLVLIPACSPRSSTFSPPMVTHATRFQAIVIYSNLVNHPDQEAKPAEKEVASGMIAKPLRSNPLNTLRRSSIETPYLWRQKLG